MNTELQRSVAAGLPLPLSHSEFRKTQRLSYSGEVYVVRHCRRAEKCDHFSLCFRSHTTSDGFKLWGGRESVNGSPDLEPVQFTQAIDADSVHMRKAQPKVSLPVEFVVLTRKSRTHSSVAMKPTRGTRCPAVDIIGTPNSLDLWRSSGAKKSTRGTRYQAVGII